MAVEAAITISEAADRLGVTPQRVSQLLRLGYLTGPDIGPGRAQKHAPRVSETSLRQEIARRRTGQRRTTRPRSADADGDVSKSAGPASVSRGRSSAREAAAFEATLKMKLGLDDAREALRREREANKRLTSLLIAATAELEAAQGQADRLDGIAEGYSEALTQLLIPDSP